MKKILVPIIFGMIGMILGTLLLLTPPPGTVAAQIMAEAIAREPLHSLPVANTALRGIQFWRSVTNLGGLFIWSAQLATVLASDRPVGLGHCRPAQRSAYQPERSMKVVGGSSSFLLKPWVRRAAP